LQDLIASLVRDALSAALADGRIDLAEVPEPELERPRDPSHG